ncbi:MAG: hypothetical protein H7A53_06130 [Akkermansiaceae bacterium]|nr:hypothetical protein [Akkermansiaceae bacterium]
MMRVGILLLLPDQQAGWRDVSPTPRNLDVSQDGAARAGSAPAISGSAGEARSDFFPQTTVHRFLSMPDDTPA